MKSFKTFLKEYVEYKVQGNSQDQDYLKLLLQSVWGNHGKIRPQDKTRLDRIAGVNVTDTDNNINNRAILPNGDMDVKFLKDKYGIELNLDDGGSLFLFRINVFETPSVSEEENKEIVIFAQCDYTKNICSKIWKVEVYPKSRAVTKKGEAIWDITRQDDKYEIKSLLDSIEVGHERKHNPNQKNKINGVRDDKITPNYKDMSDREAKKEFEQTKNPTGFPTNLGKLTPKVKNGKIAKR